MALDMKKYYSFSVYFTVTDNHIPINVIRFLPLDFYGGNHGVAVRGTFEYEAPFAEYACAILDYLYESIGYKNLYFYGENNRIHFGNKTIKLFTVAYSDEFSSDAILNDRLKELNTWYEKEGYLND